VGESAITIVRPAPAGDGLNALWCRSADVITAGAPERAPAAHDQS
jgi:hypothetical protein